MSGWITLSISGFADSARVSQIQICFFSVKTSIRMLSHPFLCTISIAESLQGKLLYFCAKLVHFWNSRDFCQIDLYNGKQVKAPYTYLNSAKTGDASIIVIQIPSIGAK